MLVMTLQVGGEVLIGGDIRLMIVAVKGKRVRVGCTAPPAVRVERRELRDRVAGSAPCPVPSKSLHPPGRGRPRPAN
jgi:carbon storage regulator CsrA